MLTPRSAAPSGAAPPSDDHETFTWTSAAPLGQASQVEHDVDRLARAAAQACRELFPRRAGYRVHEDRLCGVIRGRRYRISRHGFVGQVTVQMFATGGAYRRDTAHPLQLRVVGRSRRLPPTPRPDFPKEALTFGSMILAIASMLVMIGGHGWWAVVRHPSWSRLIDGLGLLATAALVVIAGTVAVVMIREGAALPWPTLRALLRWPTDHAADQRRWLALRERIIDAEAGSGCATAVAPGPRSTCVSLGHMTHPKTKSTTE
ncbi:MAG: hypothetical protein AAGF11_04455 [Myxococcota bacterium]